MWAHDLLGIRPDADERAVKRAYAARLKATRPEDDAAAFQRLVEARDAALDWARHGLGRPAEPGAAPAELPPWYVQEVFARMDDDDGTDEAPPPVDHEAAPPEPDGRIVFAAADHADAAAPPEPAAGFVRDPIAPPEPQPGPVPEPVVRSPRGTAEAPAGAGPEAADLLARAERLTTLAGLADTAGWRRFLAEVEELDLGRRLTLEARLAVALDRALGGDAGPLPPEPARADTAPPILAEIAAAFGWTGDVRRLARLIGGTGEVGPLVAAVEALAGPPPPARRDETGFPLIEPFDLEAYYGSAEHPMARYYRRALAAGRLVGAWSWGAALAPAWWAARRGFALPATVATAGLVAAFAAEAALRGRGHGIVFLTLAAGLLAARLALALVADRLEILRLARLVEAADAEVPARNDRRRAHLAARRPAGRFYAGALALAFLIMVDLHVAVVLVDAVRLDAASLERILPGAAPADLAARIGAAGWRDHRRRSLAAHGARLDRAMWAAGPAFAARIAALRAELGPAFPETLDPGQPARAAAFADRLAELERAAGLN